jgi:uncharacterized membrane protein YphA (DoxX/SURF4 family)
MLPGAFRPIAALVMVARVLLVSVFVFSAVSKALNFSDAVGEVQTLGLPAPALVTIMVIMVQSVGSVLLLFQRTAWLGAALLALFTLSATALAHGFWRADEPAYMRELTTFLEHLGVIGGLILAGVCKPAIRLKT